MKKLLSLVLSFMLLLGVSIPANAYSKKYYNYYYNKTMDINTWQTWEIFTKQLPKHTGYMWTSSNSRVLSVNKYGKITYKLLSSRAKMQTIKITATKSTKYKVYRYTYNVKISPLVSTDRYACADYLDNCTKLEYDDPGNWQAFINTKTGRKGFLLSGEYYSKEAETYKAGDYVIYQDNYELIPLKDIDLDDIEILN